MIVLNVVRYTPVYRLTYSLLIFTVYAAIYYEVPCLLLFQFCFILVDYSMSILLYENIFLHLFPSNCLFTKMLLLWQMIFLHSLWFPFIKKIKIDSEIKYTSKHTPTNIHCATSHKSGKTRTYFNKLTRNDRVAVSLPLLHIYTPHQKSEMFYEYQFEK